MASVLVETTLPQFFIVPPFASAVRVQLLTRMPATIDVTGINSFWSKLSIDKGTMDSFHV